jgi:chemotaxis protein histidine kinase CheA
MHIDPVQLMSFLDATETGLQLVNAIMKEPARSDAEFRKKLDGLFRELHSIKGEASALNLMSIAHRVHSLEDMVSELKKKAELSGNDFLPMVLKLDELLAHLRSVRELGSRLSALRDSAPAAAEQVVASGGKASPAKTPADELAHTLQALAERLAHDHKKKFKLSLTGIGDIPRSYIPTLKDVLIQMLRNSAVHGIENPEIRRAQTKDDTGAVRIDFKKGTDGFELMFEDDGAGLLPDQLKAAAVRKQIVTAEEAAAMDTRAAMALIFRPGFSTQEHVSMDAGRGVGMDVVAKSVYAIGGKIGVTTNPGKFTRFKVSLPASSEEASTAVA